MSSQSIPFMPSVPPSAYLRRRAALPFPFDGTDHVLYRFGRHALWHGLRALGLEPGDRVLAPAYHCGAEVEALVEAGLRVEFYEARGDLRPDPQELEGLLPGGVRALYLIHYLGFAQDSERWRRWCDELGIALIEDVAMAWPGQSRRRPLGSEADLAIYSPWKTVGLADLGALTVRGASPPPAPRYRRVAARSLATAHIAWVESRIRPGRRRYPSGAFDPESNGLGDPEVGPSRSSVFLLSRLWRPAIRERRQANYRFLAEHLGDLVPSPFRELDPAAFPYLFPLQVHARDEVVAHLRAHGVEACALWSVPHPSLPVERFPAAAHRRRTGIALPVHQDLTRRDLETIVREVGRAGASPVAFPEPARIDEPELEPDARTPA